MSSEIFLTLSEFAEDAQRRPFLLPFAFLPRIIEKIHENRSSAPRGQQIVAAWWSSLTPLADNSRARADRPPVPPGDSARSAHFSIPRGPENPDRTNTPRACPVRAA